MTHEPISDELERIGKEIVDSAYRVHKELGPGLLESVYEECMIYDLRRKSLKVDEQVYVPIEFDGQVLTRTSPLPAPAAKPFAYKRTRKHKYHP